MADEVTNNTPAEPSIQELRGRAKELKISAGGSREQLKARITEAENAPAEQADGSKGKTYRVTVTNEFRTITSAARLTAGLSVTQDGNGYVGELTDEQLAEVKADRYVSVADLAPAEVADAKNDIEKTEQEKAREAKNREDAIAANKDQVDENTEPTKIVAGTPGPADGE